MKLTLKMYAELYYINRKMLADLERKQKQAKKEKK